MAGKRKSDVSSTEDYSGHAPKFTRLAQDLNAENASSGQRFGATVDYIPLNQDTNSGQRFGESADFIPLNQLSQVVGADEEDEEALDVIQGSQEVDETSLTTSILYGMLLFQYYRFLPIYSKNHTKPHQTGIVSTKIVGVRFYRGRANPGERVIIVRDANNRYDRNAIRVDNVMGAQVGHIPRQMAAKLASYIVKFQSYCF